MRAILLMVLLTAMGAVEVWGQVEGLMQQASGGAVARAVPAAEAPTLDGRLDDAAWGSARVVTGFIQREPIEGAVASDATEVRFVYTAEALYVGARMYGDPRAVRADVARRDVESDAEQLVVSLDTYRDERTAYTFAVTASGGRIDYYHPGDSEDNRDYSFDPVWETAAVVDGDGWTAELRIPFTQLRFNPGDMQVWGLNLKRIRPALQDESLWMLVGRDETGWASRMGELRGIDGIRPSRRIELQPYVASAGTLVSGADAEDPFEHPRDMSIRAGGDVKMGLGPNLTLDATFNPDFGQVEADPAVVNLSAFEVFFDERRPFFTEGARLFDFGGLFYSRRIGAAPQGSADADYAEERDNTTILSAAKLTGQLRPGLSIGVLAALTDRETVDTYDASSEAFGEAVVEPMTGYAAARLQQQFGPDGSTVGAIVTAVRRDLDDHDNLTSLLTSTALAAGVDGRFRWSGGAYDINWRLSGTRIDGSEEAILRQQRISRRYFQRPDADYVEVDPTRTSLLGYGVGLGHSKLSGEHWLWDVDLWAESPGYEPNDFGRLGSTDGLGGFVGITYRENTPGPVFRNYQVRVMSEQEWNYGGDWTAAWYGLNLYGRLANFWTAELGIDYNPQVFSHSLTRGGPLMRRNGFRGPFVFIGSPDGRPLRVTFNAGGGDVPAGGWSYWITPSLSYRPNPQLELSVEPELRRNEDPRQYVGTRGGGPEATFGSRYIFARLNYSEIAARLRVNYAIGPELTLEGYLEPFVSSGEYSDFGELLVPRENDLRLYGTDGSSISSGEDGTLVVNDRGATFEVDDPAFHVRSFRSNLVLRWEWRPGSTLFLVWQQNRSGTGVAGERAEPGDLLRSFRASGDNFLVAKATYWLPW